MCLIPERYVLPLKLVSIKLFLHSMHCPQRSHQLAHLQAVMMAALACNWSGLSAVQARQQLCVIVTS
jgi:hypothetical protein